MELFKDGYISENFKSGSKYTKADFYEFAERISINEKRLNKIYNSMLDKSEKVENMVQNSFLSDNIKVSYLKHYYNKFSTLI